MRRALWPSLRDPSIGARLAAVVLLTGGATFGGVGVLTTIRLERGLNEQGLALSQLSAHQLAQKLDGEARLARARLDTVFAEAGRQVRALTQRTDIAKAVQSENDVTIRETFAPASKTAGLDVLLAIAPGGYVLGANTPADLLALTDALSASDLGSTVKNLLSDNSRSQRRSFQDTRRLGEKLRTALRLDEGRAIGHLAVDPVFDDFGDVIGALIGIRMLAPVEEALEHFSSLSGAGVAILSGQAIVSAAGAHPLQLPFDPGQDQELFHSGRRLARCIDYIADLKICSHADVAAAKASQEQMFRIGAEQTRSFMIWFLILAAGSLVTLVGALLVCVRQAVRGLPQLSRAATAVAHGNLDVPFEAMGSGEVHSLGTAFEAMLTNLRSSLGQIRQLAFYDPVTELANREKARIKSGRLLEQRADDEAVVFLLLDLIRFKAVKDMFGDKSTDRLLRNLAVRLTAFCDGQCASGRFSDSFVARVGTDEFLTVVRCRRDGLDLERLAEDLLAELRAPFEIGSARVPIAAHIGVAACPDHGADYETLRANADIATDAAKRQNRGTFAVFTPAAGQAALERLAIEHDLTDAVRERRFSVHYQPKVSCSDGSIIGVEALARWSHPERGYISPGKFIPIAEETGQLPEIGVFVLERAMEDVGKMLSDGLSITLAVNVSIQQLEDPSFSDAVLAVVERTKFPPKALELEITESLAMQDSEIVQKQIMQLRRTGIQIAIDDFGTGYCNLAMLSRLPIDTIKLDRSLVQDVHANPEKQTIVRTVIALARSFGFHTVVEGVETHAELDYLVREGAEMAQGYLFSPPVTIETINLLLKPKNLDGLLKDEQDEAAPNVVAYPGSARRKA